MAQFRFVMRSGPVVGKVYPLEEQEIYIGRESSNTIIINDAQVSRRHAKMESQGSGYLIHDLGSTNGTFINGARISGMQTLNPGDTVALGEGIVLVYEPVMDSNATVLSARPAQATIQQPAPAPVHEPVHPPVHEPTPPPAPAPVPVSRLEPAPVPAPVKPAPRLVQTGQEQASPIPISPVPMPLEPAPRKKKFPLWIIIVIILLVIICACVGFFVAIDQFNLWCRVVPFLVPLFGGTC
jgi:pSer/pThr/pTyr-binding forkhead associated (FHA) protein